MRIHFIGIGGFGMSGLAEYLLRQGYFISGSDLNKSELTVRLETLGAIIFYSHDKTNIPPDTELVVYSSAVQRNNPEFMEAERRKIEIIKRSEMLGRITDDSFLISVGGTHGKTSTSAMISYLLIECGFDPNVFVGGAMEFLSNGTSRAGNGKYCIVEADEYDRSFLTLKSDIAVINNIDADHLDIFSDINGVKESFSGFINNCRRNALVVANGDDKNVKDILGKTNTKKMLFGTGNHNDYRVVNIEYNVGQDYKIKFSIETDEKKINDICLKIPGFHNAMNAAAAYIVCEILKISVNQFKEIIKNFPGVKRRLELKYGGAINVYDDYAHHPAEIKSSFEAVKKISAGRIITVFQPHLYSRTKDFYREFAESLKLNDIIVLTDIYPAREKPVKGVTSALISNELRNITKNEIYNIKKENIIDFLIKRIIKNDTVIFQGAGDITGVCEEFTELLKFKIGIN
ncbi:MAG: UDP-N-acetylmuramate--L-alanine ligase [Ignavibacteria bacterium]|nr:UDP-N-acetylmuramate--L-alanine ligase [Ignavibacteria bacterium]